MIFLAFPSFFPIITIKGETKNVQISGRARQPEPDYEREHHQCPLADPGRRKARAGRPQVDQSHWSAGRVRPVVVGSGHSPHFSPSAPVDGQAADLEELPRLRRHREGHYGHKRLHQALHRGTREDVGPREHSGLHGPDDSGD